MLSGEALCQERAGFTSLNSSAAPKASSNCSRSCNVGTSPPRMVWVPHKHPAAPSACAQAAGLSPPFVLSVPGTAPHCSHQFLHADAVSLQLPLTPPGYTCICSGLFSGERCELGDSPCDSKPCLHGGTCVLSATGYSCHCPDWYLGER